MLLLLVLFVSACAPSAGGGDRTVDVHGTLTRTSASSGPEGWILATNSGTLLAVALPDGTSKATRASCVTIPVDDDFPVDGSEDEIVTALERQMNDTGEALTVTAFC